MPSSISKEEFVRRATAIHGDRYDYSSYVYTTWDVKSTIICKVHGPFQQSSRLHIERKSGCRLCGRLQHRISKSVKFDEFVKRAREVHGLKYEYNRASYTNVHSPITIICPDHGAFTIQHAYAHTANKNGCVICKIEKSRLTTEEFITTSNAIHKSYFTYDKTKYTLNQEPLIITCPEHGDQTITPRDHYRVGCWFCKRNRMQDIWLDEIGVPNTKENRQVRFTINNLLHVVDGFDPNTNSVYLFHGDYWHGNPDVYRPDELNRRNMKTFGELHQQTLEYEERLRQAGYTVISVWEGTWLQKKSVHSVVES